MIIDGLISLMLTIVEPLIGLLPVFDVRTVLGQPDELAAGVLMVDRFVPLITPLQFVADLLRVGAAFVPVALGLMVYRLIPGKMA